MCHGDISGDKIQLPSLLTSALHGSHGKNTHGAHE